MEGLDEERRALLLESMNLKSSGYDDDPKSRYASFAPLVQLTPDMFKDDWDIHFGTEV